MQWLKIGTQMQDVLYEARYLYYHKCCEHLRDIYRWVGNSTDSGKVCL